MKAANITANAKKAGVICGRFDGAVAASGALYDTLYSPSSKSDPDDAILSDSDDIPTPQALALEACEDGNKPYYMPNLTAVVRKRANRALPNSGSAAPMTVTLPTSADSAPPPFTLAMHSVALWHDGRSFQTFLQLMRFRWGHLWNMKPARRYRIRGLTHHYRRGTCPLRNAPDSGGHIMGECTHLVMKSRYMQRHDGADIFKNACRQVHLGAIMPSWMLRRATDLPEDVASKRVPYWLWTRASLGPVPSRPDMVIVEGIAARHVGAQGNPVVQHLQNRSICKVHIIAVGYTVDTRYEAKFASKRLQHASLVAGLRRQGVIVHQHVIILGSGGAVYQGTVDSLKPLGIHGDDLNRCFSKLLSHTATTAQSIVMARRRLEGGVVVTGAG